MKSRPVRFVGLLLFIFAIAWALAIAPWERVTHREVVDVFVRLDAVPARVSSSCVAVPRSALFGSDEKPRTTVSLEFDGRSKSQRLSIHYWYDDGSAIAYWSDVASRAPRYQPPSPTATPTAGPSPQEISDRIAQVTTARLARTASKHRLAVERAAARGEIVLPDTFPKDDEEYLP